MSEPRTEHVPLRRLADRRDGLLTGPRAARAEAHLAAGCAVCEERARRLESTVAAIRAGPLEPPPRAVLRAAVRLMRGARLAAALEAAHRIVATLVYDQRTSMAVALRAAPGDMRRMLWTFGDYELDGCLVTVAGGADFLGQVVPAEESGRAAVCGHVAAFREGKEVARADLAPLGRFTFRALPPGTWTIEGAVNDVAFALPPFVVAKAG